MKFIAPLKVMINKVKGFILNLNQYRNAHFRLLNDSKIRYKLLLKDQINSAIPIERAVCIYTVYPGTKRRFDLGNVCSIHQKYFEDALVEYGKLPDDNCKRIPVVVYTYGEIDRDNPRVEINVIDLNGSTIDKVKDVLYNTIVQAIERNKDEQ